jgi:hypothetical protein
MSASKPNSGAPLRQPPQANDKPSKLKKRDYIVGDPEDIVHMDWSGEWNELKNLDTESDSDQS